MQANGLDRKSGPETPVSSFPEGDLWPGILAEPLLSRIICGNFVHFLSAIDDLRIHNGIVISMVFAAQLIQNVMVTILPRRVSRAFHTPPHPSRANSRKD